MPLDLPPVHENAQAEIRTLSQEDIHRQSQLGSRVQIGRHNDLSGINREQATIPTATSVTPVVGEETQETVIKKPGRTFPNFSANFKNTGDQYSYASEQGQLVRPSARESLNIAAGLQRDSENTTNTKTGRETRGGFYQEISLAVTERCKGALNCRNPQSTLGKMISEEASATRKNPRNTETVEQSGYTLDELLIALGSFPANQVDALKEALEKKQTNEIAKFEEKFVHRAVKIGVKIEKAYELFESAVMNHYSGDEPITPEIKEYVSATVRRAVKRRMASGKRRGHTELREKKQRTEASKENAYAGWDDIDFELEEGSFLVEDPIWKDKEPDHDSWKTFAEETHEGLDEDSQPILSDTQKRRLISNQRHQRYPEAFGAAASKKYGTPEWLRDMQEKAEQELLVARRAGRERDAVKAQERLEENADGAYSQLSTRARVKQLLRGHIS